MVLLLKKKSLGASGLRTYSPEPGSAWSIRRPCGLLYFLLLLFLSRNWEKRAGLGRRRPPAGSPPGKLCCVYECVSIHIYDVLRQKRGTGLAHWPTTRSRRWQSSVDRHRGDNVHVRAPHFYIKYCHIFLDFCGGRVI